MVTTESAFWSLRKTIAQEQQFREKLGGGLPAHLNSGIRISNVSFAYDARDVLTNLSIEVPAGRLTIIIGPSGSGKTTLIDLVIGLLRPQKGSIFIDDIPISDLDIKDWRQKIGYVPEENLLLHDTVLHNVTLGDPEVDEDNVEYARKAAGAWKFVSAMPAGMRSIVGERGTKLSGGQRQHIMIARALAHRPSLFILDEATSALDPASEAAICESMEKLRGELTVLATSHQTALVESADRVYRLEDRRAVLVPQVAEQSSSVSL
jgi:ATP-binding cassette subfamily C protein